MTNAIDFFRRPTVAATSRLLFLLAIGALGAFAQNSAFGQAAQGIAQEMVQIAKWLGIIVCIICGFSMAFGGGHGAGMAGKITGLLLGLVLALFAQPIVNWVQAL